MATITIKRIYEEPSSGDGQRVLVDRIWPRGVSKDAAAVDAWLRDVAPSTALRKWFGHDPDKWDEFRQRYFAELAAGPNGLDRLRACVAAGPVTLVYSARDTEHNQAVALREWLLMRHREGRGARGG